MVHQNRVPREMEKSISGKQTFPLITEDAVHLRTTPNADLILKWSLFSFVFYFVSRGKKAHFLQLLGVVRDAG